MLAKKIAIDLGTANSLVYVLGRGIILKEPTVVAISDDDGRILAVGERARDMLGRTPTGITALRPLRSGVVADYSTTEALLKYFVHKAVGRSRLMRPDVIISIPGGATSVEARAVLDAAYSAGAKKAFLVSEPLAAAIGAGLPVAEPSGNMIVNIGGGTTEIAVVSLHGVVSKGSVRVGGTNLDQAIAQYMRRKYGLIIGDSTAENVKITAGSAVAGLINKSLEVKGRDFISGFPKIVTINTEEITQCLTYPISQISMSVKNVLETTPPELASDIVDTGIVLSGGSALLQNLDKHLATYIGVPVHRAEEPILCVVKGLGMVLEELHLFSKDVIKK